MNRQRRHGFSLIEMVIVILILGIIAAVAAPRMFETVATAEQNTTRQQLGMLRNAIEMYRAQNGEYPLENELPTALEPLLNGPFPKVNVGPNKGSAEIYYDTDADTDTVVAPDSAQAAGWAYKPANGSLKPNVADGEIGFDW